MSWFKVFSAVVVGNIVSWLVVSVLSLAVWSYYWGIQIESIQRQLESFGFSSSEQDSASGTVRRFPDPESSKPSQTRSSSSEPTVSSHVVATNRRLCLFWSEEVDRDPTELNQAYKKQACDRWRSTMNDRLRSD